MKALESRLGSSQILTDISLDVPEGSTLGILGPNGAGKSTLVRAMLGIFPPHRHHPAPRSGTAGPLARLGVDRLRTQRVTSTAGVPATALEVVSSGLLYGNSFRHGKDAKEKAMDSLERVGLAHRAHESVQTFSGGQQQRVVLARSLVRNPSLLFLDEPFSGVDKRSRELITQTLTEKRDQGLTIVVVLHELQDLKPLIDATVVIEHGRVAHFGPAPRVAEGHDHPDHDHDHEHGDDDLPFLYTRLGGRPVIDILSEMWGSGLLRRALITAAIVGVSRSRHGHLSCPAQAHPSR